MISFVWSSKYPFIAGSGGSENYTSGHMRELQRRGIQTRLLTLGFGEEDGRTDFPDLTFKALSSKKELESLDDTLVFVTYPINVKTKHKSYGILHCPISSCADIDPLFDEKGAIGKQLIAPSKFSAGMWGEYLGVDPKNIPAVYPFAEDCFGQVQRPKRKDGKVKVLFAGRLTPDKGVYTLLAALHMHSMKSLPIEITATTAGAHTEEGQIVSALFDAHPQINLTQARKSPEAMAELMAEHDIVVMPTTDIFWKEAFGILSVEAQHAGCRVVVSNSGGLPETDCGGLIAVDPDNPKALAEGVAKAAKMGPLTEAERQKARQNFTVKKSVDSFLEVLSRDAKIPAKQPLRAATTRTRR